MARKARQRISYGSLALHLCISQQRSAAQRNETLPLTDISHHAVLPLANSPGGHRLGVNGLAVDSKRSVLCDKPFPPDTGIDDHVMFTKLTGTLAAETVLSVPGTSTWTWTDLHQLPRILSHPPKTRPLAPPRRSKPQLPSDSKSKHILTG